MSLQKKQVTSGLAENHAIRAIMWVNLKMGTAFYMVAVLIHYLGVVLKIVDKPKGASEVVAEARLAAGQAKLEAERFAKDAISSVPKPDAPLHVVQPGGTV